jgi:branched-subunit amino acid transport protein
MTVLIAVLVVGAGSLVLRTAPLLAARRIPDRLTSLAGWAGLAVLAAMMVRAVLQHRDSSIPDARLVAAFSVGIGLLLAFRGRSVVLAVGAGGSTYLLIAAALMTVSH